MPSVELLDVLATFCLRPRQGDLDDVAHLRRPAPKRLDELTKGKATRRLGAKLVLMDVLHGDRILAAVRRAHTATAPVVEPACDV